jgi:hypothetical protein
MAAELDGTIELVAGAFSQDAERSRQAGVTYGISTDRAYANYEEMKERERKRQSTLSVLSPRIISTCRLRFPPWNMVSM